MMDVFSKGNIVLIGMPASGKSTVGVILAKILGMDFVDTDIIIQQNEGARLNQIIEKNGVEAFLKKEEQAILSLQARNTVIATGGSVVYSSAAMEHLATGSEIVYLKVQKEELYARLKDIQERGVVLRHDETMDEMFDIRSKLYEKYADITIYEEGLTIEDTVREIRRKTG
jgi:shikimate kinase